MSFLTSLKGHNKKATRKKTYKYENHYLNSITFSTKTFCIQRSWKYFLFLFHYYWQEQMFSSWKVVVRWRSGFGRFYKLAKEENPYYFFVWRNCLKISPLVFIWLNYYQLFLKENTRLYEKLNSAPT